MKKETDLKTLWVLSKSMFALSACTLGDGFVIVSLMERKLVEELHWMEEDEMLDITTITQSSPGSLPVNALVTIGYRVHDMLGSLTAMLGTIILLMVTISLVSVLYQQFWGNTHIAIAPQVVQAGVAAVICDVVINLAGNVCATRRLLYIAMMVTAFASTYLLGVSTTTVIFIRPGIGLADLGVSSYKKKEKSEVAVE